ncbi:MAG: hypothetical protein COW01_12280 [Bdellovibrionales bacterium CG12_big_fil_rev_8_21_14_0_65_38_15]|nr:MAG: hypothetical protein COW79_00960 [Bdellovibrionales bacterium CG22_combo_CG10-13_8_21_14_all_38_13]PIQ54108.1 MAG: hypothetical protein COW01_12280 [Bdellovibrionales bacterium CG12_big_fil_rev_8_21_14_0_65_38_15]PIR28785.1 MAG: hypothetical protein COV38_13845 [Bdellovibrionales bacterium CG11_big_fil_rev_8_21_14_0_20_38_13]
MKLVFLTQDPDIESLVDVISGVDVVLADTLDGLESEIEDERCIFFIDLDFDKKYCEKVNQELFEHENIRRVIISSGMRLKDLKKHQKGKFAAHGYLLKPLTLEIINGVLNDYELSDYILDHQLDGEEVDVDEVDLTHFSGANPTIKEFGFNPEVKAEIDKHSAKNADEFESKLNKTIQATFDDVFSSSPDDEEALNFDTDDGDDLDFGDEGIPDFQDEVDDIPTLEVNLDSSADEDLSAGFKDGLSPDDGTGEFEIDTTLLDQDEINIEDEIEEVTMASNDDLDIDDDGLEFDDEAEAELDEGALEFDAPDSVSGNQKTDALDLGASDDAGGFELGDDDVSIDLGSDDLDLGEDVDVDLDEVDSAIEATGQLDLGNSGGDLEFDNADELSGDAEIEFGGNDTDAGDLDLDENTNPTIVSTSSNIQANALNLDDDDMAEFSSQEPLTEEATSTNSENFDLSSKEEIDDEDSFSLDDEPEEATSSELAFGSDDDELNDDISSEETSPTMVAPPQELSFGSDDMTSENFASARSSASLDEPLPRGQVLESLGQPELLRLQATIKQLREERSGMIGQMDDLKSRVRLLEQDKLTLKAELEESKIEINILKKRHSEENEETKHRNRVLVERKAFFEEKAKTLQKEFDRLSQKIRIDFNKVKQREKELESQLELVTMDTQSQVKSRDMKILELKRKIDSLEFNMENATIREQKSREDKVKLEERLGKIMKTLRGSIQLLEDDIDLDEETRMQIEKARKL